VNEPWLAMFAAINPAAAVLAFRGAINSRWTTPEFGRQRLAIAVVGAAVAVGLYALLAGAADDLLDALDIAPETFRIAAGIVMAASGVFAILRLGLADEDAAPGLFAGVFPLGIPLLATAAGLSAAVSFAADHGAGRTLAAAAVVSIATAALAWQYRDAWSPVAGGLARLIGALLVVLAAGLVVEGIRDI
jgi:small neutral amino acid transporter SnatA (MarC family)